MAVMIKATAGTPTATTVFTRECATARDRATTLTSRGVNVAKERYAAGAAWLAVATPASSAMPYADENRGSVRMDGCIADLSRAATGATDAVLNGGSTAATAANNEHVQDRSARWRRPRARLPIGKGQATRREISAEHNASWVFSGRLGGAGG
jgi:hypothetical protein